MPITTIQYPKSPQIMEQMLRQMTNPHGFKDVCADELLEVTGELPQEVILFLRARTGYSKGPIDLSSFHEEYALHITAKPWPSNKNFPTEGDNLDLPVTHTFLPTGSPWLASRIYESMADFLKEFIENYESASGLPWITFPEGFKEPEWDKLNIFAEKVLYNILSHPINKELYSLSQILAHCDIFCTSEDQHFMIRKGSSLVPSLYQLHVWILSQYQSTKNYTQYLKPCQFSDFSWLEKKPVTPIKENPNVDWTWKDATKKELIAFQKTSGLFSAPSILEDILLFCDYALNVRIALEICKIEFSWSYITDFFNGTLLSKIPQIKDAYQTLNDDCSTYITHTYNDALSIFSYKHPNAYKASALISAYLRAQDNNKEQQLILYSDVDLDNRREFLREPRLKNLFEKIEISLCASKIKYYKKVPLIESLDRLYQDFPLFFKVTTFIEDQLYLSSLTTTTSIRINPILLVGGPGIGKTRYLSEVAKLLGVPFTSIGMSSSTNGWVLGGLDLSWSGGKPGMIFNTLTSSDIANPIFLLDELDKASTNQKDSPIGALYQLLEPHTARKFVDEAVGIPIDTSGCIWFATANDIESIPSPIRSRFQTFEIPKMDQSSARTTARSIYTSFIQENDWGPRFKEVPDDNIINKMAHLSPRDMRFVLQQAFASAAKRNAQENRNVEKIDLLDQDLTLNRPSSGHSIGFSSR